MKKYGSKDCGGDIQENTCGISKESSKIGEHNLVHRMQRADIEKIDISYRLQKKIAKCGDRAANKVEQDTTGTGRPLQCILQASSGGNADDDEKNMPGEGMHRQRKKIIMHPGSIKKGKDSTQ